MSRRGLRLSRGSLRPSWRGLCLSQSGLRLSRRGLRLSRRGLRVSHSCLQPGVFISPPSPDGLDSAVLRCCPSLRRWRAACRGLRPGSFLWPPRQMAWPAGGVAWRRRRRRAALRVPGVWAGLARRRKRVAIVSRSASRPTPLSNTCANAYDGRLWKVGIRPRADLSECRRAASQMAAQL